MRKRQIYLPQSDNASRRIQRDLEFLRDYWDRLFIPDQNYDVRLPELLRANHLMKQLSQFSPSNHGLRVNVNFTMYDDIDNCLEPEDTYAEMYQLCNMPFYNVQSHNGRLLRLPYNINTSRNSNPLEDYIRQMSENTAIQRELIRARLLAPLIEQDRIARQQNTPYNQRTTTSNWNKSPMGNRSLFARASSRLQERLFHPQENNNHQVPATFQPECYVTNGMSKNTRKDHSVNQQSVKQKENSPELVNDLPKMSTNKCLASQDPSKVSPFSMMFRNLQPHNNNFGVPSDRNEVRQNSKKPMEACHNVSKIINAPETSSSIGLHVKPESTTMNNDKQSIDPSMNCQRSIQQCGLTVVTDRNMIGQGCGTKRKLNDLEDHEKLSGLNLSRLNRTQKIGMVRPHIKDMPMIFGLNDNTSKTVSGKIKNGRLMKGRQFSRKYSSPLKYTSFLRMCRKEEIDERLKDDSTSRKDKAEKSQSQRDGIPTRSVGYDNRMFRDAPQIKRRNRPTPRSTVHTAYNPMIHSSATDPILDYNGFTIQLLRLTVLLYVPALMPALNSLIARQNHQTPLSIPCFEGSNDLLIHIFRLLNEKNSIPNLSLVSFAENTCPSLAAQTSIGNSSNCHSEEENMTTASSSKQRSISTRMDKWKSNKRNEEDKSWRLASTLGSNVKLDRNIFKAQDFRRFEQFLKTEKNQGNVRSLSMRNKNKVVMKDYFRNWLHQLLQQMNMQVATNSHSSSNDTETEYLGELSKITDDSHLKEIKDKQSSDHQAFDKFLDSSRNYENIEDEEEDSDDRESSISTSSSYSSRSMQFEEPDNGGDNIMK